MRNTYVPIGSVLSFLLMLAGPRLPSQRVTASDPAAGRPHVVATAEQFAQDESNDSDTNGQPDQPGDNNSSASGDNSDQTGAQPGDQGGDSPDASSSDDNGGDSQQMNADPDNSDNADPNNQNSDDQQNQQNSNYMQ
jgi:hypothetical protein